MTTNLTAYSLFTAADAAWRKELRRCYGKSYQPTAKEQRGGAGTNLRLLAENRDAARDQWERVCFAPRVFDFAAHS